MTTFIGEFPCKLDSKGRIILPSAFKRQLDTKANDRFVVKKDLFDKCLVLYPLDEWERQVAEIRSRISKFKREHSQFLNQFYKGAAELILDSSSRLLIPKRLLDEVGIKKEIILAGQDDMIKLWDQERYESYTISEDDYTDLAERIFGENLNSGG